MELWSLTTEVKAIPGYPEVTLRIHHGFLLKRAKDRGSANEAMKSVVNARRACNYDSPSDLLQEALASYFDYFGTYPPEGSQTIPYLVSAEEALYYERLSAAISRYLALEANINLRLTAYGEDWICQSYSHRKHCSLETVFTNHERKMATQLAEWKKRQNIPGKFYVRKGFENKEFFALTTMGVFWSLMESITNPVEVFCD